MDGVTRVPAGKDPSGGVDSVKAALDKRVYYLRTLYDISKELFGKVDFDIILKNFLLMTMGNFGVFQCVILTCNTACDRVLRFFSIGFDEPLQSELRGRGCRFLATPAAWATETPSSEHSAQQDLHPDVALAFPFRIDDDQVGLVGLGPKLTEEPFRIHDRELLGTLVNNLVVALRNALSFEQISGLNRELQVKNEELEKTLGELQAALRKVEILESIKANLCKFVPATVTSMIERSPTSESLDASERDLSVMFLDIEGYSRLTEEVGGTEVNNLVEKYFSVFMDAIYTNNGDVMETAGDGLMVLFLSDDEKTHALEAIRAAAAIRSQTNLINRQSQTLPRPLAVNIGVASGEAFLGALKFESPTGSRWTYTAHGTLVNIAARICDKAKGGSIMAVRNTVERVTEEFPFASLGSLPLKNISDEVEIFELESP